MEQRVNGVSTVDVYLAKPPAKELS